MSHGSILYFILLTTLIPFVKDNLADITVSDNYRAIPGGSLLFKLFDVVILLLNPISAEQLCGFWRPPKS